MSGWVCRLCSLALFSSLAVAAGAQTPPPLRLKGRTFVPPANVRAAAALARPRVAIPGAAVPRRHLLIQFADPITAASVAALRAQGVIVLRYVPENALAISAGAGFDASSIPGARWVGGLDPSDRISRDTAADLQRSAPRYPLTVVEFHADVDRAGVDASLGAAGATRVDAPRLPPYMAIVRSDLVAIEALGTDESVAWIYPGPANAGSLDVLACEGTVTADGVLANFATVGEGWDGAGLGSVDLGYFLQTPSVDVSRSLQVAELERAMAEWSRFVDVRWHVAARADDVRTVTVAWAPTDHGDGYPFSPEVLAHTFYPTPSAPETIAGDLHFNENYLWGASDPSRYDIYSVGLHELGHALGLAHSSDPGAVMYPMYGGVVSGLAGDDIKGARSLYAPAADLSLPLGWADQPVGSTIGGQAFASAGRYVVEGGGADVWGTADELRFVSTPLAGDGDVVARVDSLEDVHRWTKAGVMIRASVAPGSPHAFMLVSAEKGLAFQRRLSTDGLTVSTDGIPGVAPQWLWLSRRGNTIRAYAAASEGDPWRLVGADTIALGASALAGLAVTSHDATAAATAVFSHVSVTPARQWTGTDVGAVGRAGSWTPSLLGGTVAGAGDDIWDAADAFHFAWTPLHGDGEIIARVASVEYVRAWTKAGVMIRANLTAGSPHALMLVSAGKGAAFQRRLVQDGWSLHTAAGTIAAPAWLRLVRSGNIFTAFRSVDGTGWVEVGQETIAMPQDALIGLAVSSHTSTVAARAVFDHVSVK